MFLLFTNTVRFAALIKGCDSEQKDLFLQPAPSEWLRVRHRGHEPLPQRNSNSSFELLQCVFRASEDSDGDCSQDFLCSWLISVFGLPATSTLLWLFGTKNLVGFPLHSLFCPAPASPLRQVRGHWAYLGILHHPIGAIWLYPWSCFQLATCTDLNLRECKTRLLRAVCKGPRASWSSTEINRNTREIHMCS